MTDDAAEDYEDVTIYDLDADVEEQLLAGAQRVHVHLVEQGGLAGRRDHVVRLARRVGSG